MVQSITNLRVLADAAEQAYDYVSSSTINVPGSVQSFINVFPEVTNGSGGYSAGFSATAHLNVLSGELIVSFGGTEGGPAGADWWNNYTQIGFGGTSLQPTDAITYAEAAIAAATAVVAPLNQAVNDIKFVGHSLGGYLALFTESEIGSSISSAIAINAPRLDFSDGLDAEYYYSDPLYWDFSTAAIHNIGYQTGNDTWYLNDPVDRYDPIVGSFGEGHALEEFIEALEASPTTNLVSEQSLIQEMSVTILLDGYQGIFDNYGRVNHNLIREASVLAGGNECFPAGTTIRMWDGSLKPIEEIQVSDVVASFNDHGDLVPGKVSRLLPSITSEWVVLSTGTIVTPGHRFLRPDGSFAEIQEILQEDGQIVREDGSIEVISAQRISYSSETAHLYPVEDEHAYSHAGNAALSPQLVSGWKTYNFTVTEHHTYIADGIRVHNDSILTTLQEGDQLVAVSDDLTDAALLRDVNADGDLDFVVVDGFRRSGEATEIATERHYHWDSVDGDLSQLLEDELVTAPSAVSNIFDPTAGQDSLTGTVNNHASISTGNRWNDGSFGDDIEEVFFDDVLPVADQLNPSPSATPSRATIDSLYAANGSVNVLNIGGQTFGSLSNIGALLLNTAAIDALKAVAMSSQDAIEIAAWVVGADPSSPLFLAAVGSTFDDVPDRIDGTSGDDSIDGTSGDEEIDGLSGNDTINGLAGDDTLLGNAGNDVLIGGVGADVLDGGLGVDEASYLNASANLVADLQFSGSNSGEALGDTYTSVENISGSTNSDDLRGDGENNVVIGLAGNDTLHGRSGDDTLQGGDGDDILLGNDGADELNGGAGVDRVAYWNSGAAVLADLQFANVNTGDAFGDSFTGIENLHGSTHDDNLRGDSLANIVFGDDGNDVIHGRDGDDTLRGNDGDDVLLGGAGADLLQGAAGVDRAAYWTAAAGLTADLKFAAQNTGEALGDVYNSIENLQGSNFNDKLRGSDGDNTIWGGTGVDVLDGKGGDDILIGGAGADKFDFRFGSDGDVINDFEDDIDVIRLGNMSLGSVQNALGFASQVGSHVEFDFGGGDTLTILNINVGDLSDDILV